MALIFTSIQYTRNGGDHGTGWYTLTHTHDTHCNTFKHSHCRSANRRLGDNSITSDALGPLRSTWLRIWAEANGAKYPDSSLAETIAFTGVGQSTATTTDAGDRETVRDFAHKVCVTLLSVVVAGNFCGKRVAATESETQHVRTAQRQQLVWRVAPDRCCFTPPPLPFPFLPFLPLLFTFSLLSVRVRCKVKLGTTWLVPKLGGQGWIHYQNIKLSFKFHCPINKVLWVSKGRQPQTGTKISSFN